MSALRTVSQSLKYPAAKIKKSKHKKLDEEWFDTREPIQDGMRFNAKYLGMTLITEPQGEEVSTTAVQRIINMAKGNKKQSVQLVVSSNGIQVFDPRSTQLISDISVHRISYCAALKHHLKIFAFVAQSHDNKTMECHAYLCNSVKEAQSLTFTVAQSFKIAFEIREEISRNNIDTPNVPEVIESAKTNAMTIPNISERRYQRFSAGSDPFDESDSESKLSNASEEFQNGNAKESNDFGDVFEYPPHETSPVTTKKATPITPLRPPPSRNGDKSNSRRTSRPASMGSPFSPVAYQTTRTPPLITPDNEDLDKDFADLALSRTKGSVSSTGVLNGGHSASYPSSNPFFSPTNPFG